MKLGFKKTEKKQTKKRFVDSAKKKQRKAAKRRKLTPFLFVISVFIIAAAVYLCLTMLFNVDRVKIEGNTIYEEADLIKTSGIEKGDNLFEVDIAFAEDKLYSVYSHIEEVEVSERVSADDLGGRALPLVRRCVDQAPLDPVGHFGRGEAFKGGQGGAA